MDNKKKEILKSLAGSASTKIDLNKVSDEWKNKDIFNYDYNKVYLEDECEWDVIREICQNAIKRKGYTIEQVKENCERILEEVREESEDILNNHEKDTFDEMMKVGQEFKKVLGLSDEYTTLNLIREKNITSTTLLGSSIEPQEYSDELIKQCKEEFETFVKPIRDKVIGRYIDNCTNKYNKSLKNLADK